MRCVFPRLQRQNRKTTDQRAAGQRKRGARKRRLRCSSIVPNQDEGETMLANASVAQTAVCYCGTAQKTRQEQKRAAKHIFTRCENQANTTTVYHPKNNRPLPRIQVPSRARVTAQKRVVDAQATVPFHPRN